MYGYVGLIKIFKFSNFLAFYLTPIVKNRTGDISCIGNYRSLATIIGKALDGLLNKHLRKHI